ncbi:hypothetical protein DFH07DRAFT_779045 [Mycena maculata]|uniref:Uncharacterized protein n=1 Tax=Mycena maculata TaxID=230809 RepID=A0AAD7IB31_9AGAR|nr:hypothetical protein DFH07DRAFT_779045 [Mycena maculata]
MKALSHKLDSRFLNGVSKVENGWYAYFGALWIRFDKDTEDWRWSCVRFSSLLSSWREMRIYNLAPATAERTLPLHRKASVHCLPKTQLRFLPETYITRVARIDIIYHHPTNFSSDLLRLGRRLGNKLHFLEFQATSSPARTNSIAVHPGALTEFPVAFISDLDLLKTGGRPGAARRQLSNEDDGVAPDDPTKGLFFHGDPPQSLFRAGPAFMEKSYHPPSEIASPPPPLQLSDVRIQLQRAPKADAVAGSGLDGIYFMETGIRREWYGYENGDWEQGNLPTWGLDATYLWPEVTPNSVAQLPDGNNENFMRQKISTSMALKRHKGGHLLWHTHRQK